MIRSADIRNLTVFNRLQLRPAAGLNVIIGENGTGKTHLLKLLYCVAYTLGRNRKALTSGPTKTALQVALAEKLVNVFRPEALGRIARRRRGRERCDVAVRFDQRSANMEFSFATNSKSEVQIEQLPEEWLNASAAYLPTREILTIFPNFVSIYEGNYLEFEETWRDTSILLGAPLTRGPKEPSIRQLLEPLEDAMGGSIVLDKNGRFYLNSDAGKMEMPLVAEGLRKLGMIARLIATGMLVGKGYLFWDEPESNLNPRLVKQVARTIVALSNGGIQVFIATHSLFLLREIEIIQRTGEAGSPIKFIGLAKSREGISVSQGEELSDINCITALDEELSQSDRFLETD